MASLSTVDAPCIYCSVKVDPTSEAKHEIRPVDIQIRLGDPGVVCSVCGQNWRTVEEYDRESRRILGDAIDAYLPSMLNSRRAMGGG